ncbi:hypothetical protein [Rhodophyticola sp. CCM32]|nr:hypothetical protein [Rhodophyticola sp. CCM32]
MTNTVAAWLAAVIIAIFAADHFVFDWGLPLILGRLMLGVLDWVAFWR